MHAKKIGTLAGGVFILLATAHFAESQEGKEYIPVNKRFKILMPAGDKSGSRTQIVTIKGLKCPIETSYSQKKDGLSFSAGSVGIPAKALVGTKAEQRFDMMRDSLVKSMGGKVVDEKQLKQGKLDGRDYQVEGKKFARIQMFNDGGFFFLAIVEGKTKEEISSKAADAFFESFKMTPEAAEGK